MAPVHTTLATETPPEAEEVEPGVVATILAHPDFRRLGEQAEGGMETECLSLSRLSPGFARPGGRSAPIEVANVSRAPVRLLRVGADLVLDPGGRVITVDGVAVSEPVELPSERLTRGLRLGLARQVCLWVRRGRVCEDDAALGLVGPSPEMRTLRERVRELAQGQRPVLLTGPTGSGKDRVARLIHALGPGSAGAWVSLNATVSDAERVRDALVQADGGTLYLDGIGEFPPALLARLVQHLDRPEGASRVRVLASATQPMSALLSGGRVPPALVHRLSGGVVVLTALRSRPDDLMVQARGEALRALAELGPGVADDSGVGRFPPEAQGWVLRHAWPGNTRELELRIRSLVLDGPAALTDQATAAFSISDAVVFEPSPGELELVTPRPRGAGTLERRFLDRLDGAARALLAKGNLSVDTLARRVGMSRRQLHREVHRVLGLAPIDWMTERRLELARAHILQARVHTVAEAAALAGMTPAWFSRRYSARFGATPSEDLSASNATGAIGPDMSS